jgi:hypothetical protein
MAISRGIRHQIGPGRSGYQISDCGDEPGSHAGRGLAEINFTRMPSSEAATMARAGGQEQASPEIASLA